MRDVVDPSRRRVSVARARARMAKGKAKKRLARAAKEVKASKAAPDEEAGGGHAAATSFAAKAKGASVADSQTQARIPVHAVAP